MPTVPQGEAHVPGIIRRVRFDGAGTEILRFGFGYVMRIEDERWKIVVALAHDPPPGH